MACPIQEAFWLLPPRVAICAEPSALSKTKADDKTINSCTIIMNKLIDENKDRACVGNHLKSWASEIRQPRHRPAKPKNSALQVSLFRCASSLAGLPLLTTLMTKTITIWSTSFSALREARSTLKHLTSSKR